MSRNFRLLKHAIRESCSVSFLMNDLRSLRSRVARVPAFQLMVLWATADMMKRYRGRGSQSGCGNWLPWIVFGWCQSVPLPLLGQIYVQTNILPVVARQLAEKIEFNDFKKALNKPSPNLTVIRSLKLSLVIWVCFKVFVLHKVGLLLLSVQSGYTLVGEGHNHFTCSTNISN